MEAKFKQKDGLQTLEIIPRNDAEKVLIKEFMNKEIPGYDHSLQFQLVDGKIELAFHPTLSERSLMKEIMGKGIDNPYSILRGEAFFEMDRESHSYIITNLNVNEIHERGVLKNIYEYRKIFDKLNGYAGAWGV